MSIQSELDKTNARVEFILCIEGIGWPTDVADLSQGLDGDVWVSCDINGTLAADLTCTIHQGLTIGSSYTEEVDAVAVKITYGPMRFGIADVDGFALTTFATRSPIVNTDTIDTVLLHHDSTVSTTSGTFATGDVVWLGGIECVKLGTKAGTDYTGSTRGYLGTPRGPIDWSRANFERMKWPALQQLDDRSNLFTQRKMRLYMHAPGETVSNLYLLWQGKLSEMQCADDQINWTVGGDHSIYERANRVATQPTFSIASHRFVYRLHGWDGEAGQVAPEVVSQYPDKVLQEIQINSTMEGSAGEDAPYGSDFLYSVLWRYRWTEYGTKALWSETAGWSNVYTEYDDANAPISGALINVEGYFIRLQTGKLTTQSVTLPYRNMFYAEVDDRGAISGGSVDRVFAGGTQAMWYCDTALDSYVTNRFSVNTNTFDHPIDIALCFLMTMPGEFQLNSDLAGCLSQSGAGSTTVFTRTTGDGTADDFWVGYWLFGSTQATPAASGNKWYARRITASTSTTITTVAFPYAWAAGDKAQIRNSMYDVLDFGWGAALHHDMVDVGSFLDIKARFFPGAKVPPFAFGGVSSWDIIEFVESALLRPLRCFMYMNRETGKLTLGHLGWHAGDGLETGLDYVAVNTSNIIAHHGTNYSLGKPLARVNLIVRGWASRQVRPASSVYRWDKGAKPGDVIYKTFGDGSSFYSDIDSGFAVIQPTALGDAPDQLVTVVNGDARTAQSYYPEGRETKSVTATMWTIADHDVVAGVAKSTIEQYSTPPPIVTLTVSVGLFTSLRAGEFVFLTWASVPVNPYSTSRGWSNTVGRVLSLDWSPSQEPTTMKIKVEILGDDLNGGLIAPAATIPSQVYGAGTALTVDDDSFVTMLLIGAGGSVSEDKDWYYFAAGDLVEIRDYTGAQKAAFTIVDFGANNATDPTEASTSTINLDSSVSDAGAWAAGDYITFSSWTTTQPTRMDDYVALANSATELLDGADPAKEYS